MFYRYTHISCLAQKVRHKAPKIYPLIDPSVAKIATCRMQIDVNWKVLPQSSSSVAEWCSIFRSQTEFPSTPASEVITLCSTGKSVWCLCFCFTFPLFTCQVAEGAEYWLKIIASQCNYTSSVGFYRAGVVRPITIRYTFLFAAQRNEQLF